ncbi:hypothetical protein [Streptomyces sp. NPDC088748]|uniref:hypothetical protein n=1 Tax=Streptomyces sp. NPDC088748 TaxID=3365887 RepID=UPI0038070CBB
MLTDLIRRITQLATPHKSAKFSCGKCSVTVQITNGTDPVGAVVDIALAHNCTPVAKSL